MKELIRVRVQYASRQQCCKTHKRPLPLPFYQSVRRHVRGAGFKKKVTEHKICVLIFSTTLVETFLILRRNERDMIKSVYWSYVTALYSYTILMNLDFF